MLNAPAFVACASHAMLSGYLAYALMRGAQTLARRDLAWAFFSFCTYSVILGSSYASHRPLADLLSYAAVVFGFLCMFFVHRFALRLGRPSTAARPSAWLLAPLLVLIAVSLDAGRRALAHEPAVTELIVTQALVLTPTFAAAGVFLREVRSKIPRTSRAARAFALVCLWPIVPLVLNAAIGLGLDGARVWYAPLRNLSLMMFLYTLIVAYLDHADEPMSLRERFVAGTLTVVLAMVSVGAEVLVHGRREALILLVLALGASFVVVVVFPRLYQKNMLDPLHSLVEGMRRLEKGDRNVSLSVTYDDELGYVTGAFNHLVTSLGGAERDLAGKLGELRAKNDEVRRLNDELRQQVAARSRELADALAHALPTGSRAIVAGDVVNDRYRVGRVLGAGGMGTVHEVERISDGRRLALKVMQNTTAENVTRFAREAQIAAPLDHENLVSIADVGIWRGVAYLVMELVEGGSLEDQRARFGDVTWALKVLAQMARALVALHDRSIVHRDLKPANVLLSGTPDRLVVKITDFGISFQEVGVFDQTLGAKEPALSRLTATGDVLGTLPYMAPEFARGSRGAGAPADIFAFGLIAHELVTGEPAFDVPPVLTASRGLPPPHPLPRTIEGSLARAMVACLNVDPDKRPTARALVLALA